MCKPKGPGLVTDIDELRLIANDLLEALCDAEMAGVRFPDAVLQASQRLGGALGDAVEVIEVDADSFNRILRQICDARRLRIVK